MAIRGSVDSSSEPISGSIRARARSDCPACGSSGAVLYEGLRDGSYGAPGEWTLKRCIAVPCGLIWLDPTPVSEDLLIAYRNYYTHGQRGAEASGTLKKMYRLLVDALLGLFGILAERRRADWMFIENEPPGSLLDVGCGQGLVLSRMAERGWKIMGVDFDPDAVNAARTLLGVDVRVGGIESIAPDSAAFDVITASHVIEHVHDPRAFLSHCKRLLKPGGRVILRTPNANSLGHRTYREAWRGLEPPRHLCIFTPTALRLVAGQAGLETIDCFTSYAMAESVLVVSHFLRKDGFFDPGSQTSTDLFVWKTLGPLLAIRAKIAWLRDKNCGEEICAVLRRGALAAPE